MLLCACVCFSVNVCVIVLCLLVLPVLSGKSKEIKMLMGRNASDRKRLLTDN